MFVVLGHDILERRTLGCSFNCERYHACFSCRTVWRSCWCQDALHASRRQQTIEIPQECGLDGRRYSIPFSRVSRGATFVCISVFESETSTVSSSDDIASTIADSTAVFFESSQQLVTAKVATSFSQKTNFTENDKLYNNKSVI